MKSATHRRAQNEAPRSTAARYPAKFSEAYPASPRLCRVLHSPSSPQQAAGYSAKENKPPLTAFIAASVFVFFLTLSAADSIGFVPCQIDDTCLPGRGADTKISASQNIESATPLVQETLSVATPPTHIKIAAIDMDLPMQNPMTTDFEALDIILKKGPARHALSGLLGQENNMIIFGHSSHLPIVHNQMYKAFNRVPELKAGDSVEIEGEDGHVYLYSVVSVEKEDAKNFTENFLASPDKQLIIVTCDTLAGKSARYIVRADFIGAVAQ